MFNLRRVGLWRRAPRPILEFVREGVSGSPSGSALPVGAVLPPAAVAARLGVAPGTLRTWDRRYGLSPSIRTAGAHRRYGPDDLARLQHMRRLLLDGVPAAEAARVALAAEPLPEEPPAPEPEPLDAPAADADRAARGLVRAARALDADAMRQLLLTQLAERGAVAAWEQVLRPALRSVGARWAATGEGVDVEHLLVRCTTAALQQHAAALLQAPVAARPVLLASAPAELHELPLHALAAALAEDGVGARVLGAGLPAPALASAVRRTAPSGVLVWAQAPATADAGVLASVPSTRPAATVLAGGPGWPAGLPAHVERVDGLLEAAGRLAAAAGTRPRR